MPRATQQTLGLEGVKAKTSTFGPKPAPRKKCRGCGAMVVVGALQGTSVPNAKTGPSGQTIKCDPEMVDDGQFFLVGKIFHRRRDTDDVGKFYREHRCSGWGES